MKKLSFIITLFVLLVNSAEAKIWRVNNNVGITADFTTAQAAHNSGSVVAGDTLYFEHSANGYGPLDMTKGLKLLGAGYFLTENPNLQYNLNQPLLVNILVRPSASNTVISVSCVDIIDSANNLTITRCRTGNLNFRGVSGCTVANCFVSGTIALNTIYNPQACTAIGCTGMSLFNNLIYGGIIQDQLAYWLPNEGGCPSVWTEPHSLTVFNNSVSGALFITGSSYNNICTYINTDGSTPVTNTIFLNPKTASTRTTFLPANATNVIELEAGNANQFSILASDLYTGSSSISQRDTSWHLKPGCVAIGAGTGGMDCGGTGGSNPYVFGAQPAIPAIYKLNVAPNPSGNTIGVNISTRSNN